MPKIDKAAYLTRANYHYVDTIRLRREIEKLLDCGHHAIAANKLKLERALFSLTILEQTIDEIVQTYKWGKGLVTFKDDLRKEVNKRRKKQHGQKNNKNSKRPETRVRKSG